MKKLLLSLSVFLSLNVLAQDKTLVTVSYKGFKNSENLGLKINGESVTILKEGNLLYQAELPLTKAVEGTVSDYKSGRYTRFWIEPGHGKVTVFKKNFLRATTVEGSENHRIYKSIRVAQNPEERAKIIFDHIDYAATRHYLNHNFQFSKLADDDLRKMYASIAPEYLPEMDDLRAYLDTRDIPAVKVDAMLYDFIAEDAEGQSFNTEDYRGQYLLIDFAATGCGPCWTGYPAMIEEVAKYDNLAVLTLNEDQAIETWKRIAKSKDIDITWPVLWKSDTKKETIEVYDIKGWPTFFLISPKGKVLDTWNHAGHARLRASLKKHVE